MTAIGNSVKKAVCGRQICTSHQSITVLNSSQANVSSWHSVLYFGGGSPGDSDSKESACYMGDLGLIPGSGRSPGEMNGLYIGSCSVWLWYSYSELLFLHFESVFLVFLFSALLRYNSHIIFCKFKVYKIMI